MIKLICPECRRENEAERIYCHDCGARLDRSALAKVAPKEEDPKATQRRLKSMLDPQRAKMRQMFFKISKMVLGAFLLAAVIQMLLPPDVPPMVKNTELPPPIGLDLENAVTNPGAGSMRYTEAQVNAFLAGTLKNKKAVLNKLLDFERALVNFDENLCRITAHRSLFGLSIYMATANSVSLQNGTFVVSNKGGSIGRLPVHPAVMKYSDLIFGDLWSALDREKKSVAKMGAIEFQPQTVIITPKQ